MGVRSPEAGEQDLAPPRRLSPGPPPSSVLILTGGLALVLLVTGWHRAWPPPEGAPWAWVLAPARVLFALDDAGRTVAGRILAASLCALAAGVLFAAVGHRQAESDARWTALLFALGTGVWTASLGLGPQPLALLLLSAAVLCTVRAEDEPAWAGRAGLPLALLAALRPLDLALAAALALGLALRWPRRVPLLLLWAAPGFGLIVYKSIHAGLAPLSEAGGWSHLALLLSPVRGLLVVAPVTLVAGAGLVSAFRRGERALGGTFGVAVLAHWALVGLLTTDGGPGAEALMDLLPVLLLFLPEGLEAMRGLGVALAALSVVTQAAAVLTDAGRWERLYASDARARAAAEWDLEANPVAFAARERVLVLGLPGVSGGKAHMRLHPLVPFGPAGSRIEFGGSLPTVTGAEALLGHVRLTGGARLGEGRLRLRAPGDGVFLRARGAARVRRLQLRIAGSGRGTLVVSERTFWSTAPRAVAYPVAGGFRLKHPYHYPESGGPDVTVSLGPGGGGVDLESVTLAGPRDPENPIRLPSAR